MTYELRFIPAARKEWDKLGHTIREQFKKKLAARLSQPKSEKDSLSGGTNLYKIKLRSSGYRLVYEVDDIETVVLVVAVGKRNRSEVYDNMQLRLDKK